MPRLVDHAKRQLEGLPGRLDDIAEQEVSVVNVRWMQGNFGPYSIIQVVDSNGETQEIMTGAFLIMDALENADKERAFPLQAKFIKKGRTWTIE